jgi:hypothetical protein
MSRYAIESVIVVLVVLWLVAAFVYPVGGPIHLLLFLALVATMFRIFQGRRLWDRSP